MATTRQFHIHLLAAAVLAGAALVGCGGDTEQADTGGAPPAVEAGGEAAAVGAAAGPGGITTAAALVAVDPWVRVAIVPEGSDAPDAPPVNSAGYVVLRNTGDLDDALVAVETAVAETVELHSVSMAEGVMRMRQVEEVPVLAGDVAVLEPGGYHIMLIGITRALEEGDVVPLTLRMASGATLEIDAPVLRAPPG